MSGLLEEVIGRLAYARPGFRLAHFEDVALPYFRVTLDATIQRRKEVPPIEEFVLRAAQAGLNEVEDLAGYLGLEQALVEAAVVSLWQADAIDYGVRPGDTGPTIRLTEEGKRAARELRIIAPERTEIHVFFDRLTWKPAIPADAWLLKPRTVRDLGLREIPARLSRRLELEDMSVEAITALLHAAEDQGTDYDLLAIRGVRQAERLFQRAVMLVYIALQGRETEVAFAIDGRLSRDHEAALAEVGGAERLSLTLEPETVTAEALAADLALPPDLIAPSPDVEQLQETIAEARARLDQVEASTQVREVTEEPVEDLTQLRAQLRERLESAEAALAAIEVRRVQVFEHPELLQEALRSATTRLLIISPWIKAAVVNSDFLSSLERACRRGVTVHIGYGIGDSEGSDKPWDREAESELKSLAGRFANFTLTRLGYTHAKVLIWDQTQVTTSFNWLSFKGDPSRTFRQEEGILIRKPDLVDSHYAEYRDQIEEAATRSPA